MDLKSVTIHDTGAIVLEDGLWAGPAGAARSKTVTPTSINRYRGAYPATPLHSHDFWETASVLEGRGRILTQRDPLPLVPGRFFVFPPGFAHAFDATDTIDVIFVGIAGTLPDGFPFDAPASCVDPAIGEMVQRMWRLVKQPQSGVIGMMLDGLARTALGLFLRQYETGTADKPDDEDFWDRLTGYLHHNMDKTLSVSGMARAFACSERVFYNRVVSATGMSPSKYLTQLRMEAAATMLRSTSLLVAHIAPLVGYPDPLHFSRVFSRTMGCSPSAYRLEAGGKRKPAESSHEGREAVFTFVYPDDSRASLDVPLHASCRLVAKANGDRWDDARIQRHFFVTDTSLEERDPRSGWSSLLAGLSRGQISGLIFPVATERMERELRSEFPRVPCVRVVTRCDEADDRDPRTAAVCLSRRAFLESALAWVRHERGHDVRCALVHGGSDAAIESEWARLAEALGVATRPEWALALEPEANRAVRSALALLLRAGRQAPEALVIADGRLLAPVTRTLVELGVRVPADLAVAGYAHFPEPDSIRAAVPVRLFGYRTAELLTACVTCLRAQEKEPAARPVVNLPLVAAKAKPDKPITAKGTRIA